MGLVPITGYDPPLPRMGVAGVPGSRFPQDVQGGAKPGLEFLRSGIERDLVSLVLNRVVAGIYWI